MRKAMRLLRVRLAVLTIGLGLPATVEAQSYTNSYGIWGYTINPNATITITGYTGPGGAVTIPSEIYNLPVTSIGDRAFDYCIGLTSVTIPNSVASIGEDAFRNCASLTSVTIPDSVTSIEEEAFESCGSLTSVTIPDSVTSIGEEAFFFCTSLANVTIGNSVTNIADDAFQGCTSLTSVTIGNSVTSIGGWAFWGCPLSGITIPDSVTSIGDSAFFNCTSLTSVYFQGNAPSLGSLVFDGDNYCTLYYLPGTTGWEPLLANRPAVLWNPQVQPGSLGVRTNQFGLNIIGSRNLVIVIEATTSLASPTWLPLQTNTLTGSPLYFSDPQWTNYPSRFYRVTWP
jgi:hypothetical protein